ncbi:MAG: dihydroorotase family protein [Parcubacteria group bacterium]|nr:dihydroorotase family protein [Parcubacteria group bacterium]
MQESQNLPDMWELRRVRLYPGGRLVCIQFHGTAFASITDRPQCERYVDGNGYLALPGFIDSHIHDRTSGYPEYDEPDVETVRTIVLAALAGGVTTVVAMPNPRKPTTTIEALERKIALIRDVAITYKLLFGATKDNTGEIAQLGNYLEWVLGVKLYMEPTTGDILVREIVDQRRVMASCAEAGLSVVSHVGNARMLEQNRAQFAEPHLTDHCTIRHPLVELDGTNTALQLARETGCRLHIAHATLPSALALIDNARLAGRLVTAEVCVQHLVRHDGFLQGLAGSLTSAPLHKVNPPLRSAEDMRQLVTDALSGGRADTTATDHAPHSFQKKMRARYDDIPSGMTGLQTYFHIMFNFFAQGIISFERLIELTSRGPARIFGLANKGRIEAGADADLVVVDPEAFVQIREGNTISPCGWTPYHGMECRGAIKAVVARGKLHNSQLTMRTNTLGRGIVE